MPIEERENSREVRRVVHLELDNPRPRVCRILEDGLCDPSSCFDAIELTPVRGAPRLIVDGSNTDELSQHGRYPFLRGRTIGGPSVGFYAQMTTQRDSRRERSGDRTACQQRLGSGPSEGRLEVWLATAVSSDG